MDNSIKDRFVEVLVVHLKHISSEYIDFGKELKTLGLDSMSSVDLIFDLEDQFDIILPDEYLTEETFLTAESLWSVVSVLIESKM